MWESLKALRVSLAIRGLRPTLARAVAFLADKTFDAVNRTDTFSSVDVRKCAGDREVKLRAGCYEPTRVLPLRALFKSLRENYLSPDSVLVDFGCGKGRVLLVASEYGVKLARGIEFAEELCVIARSNCEALKSRRKTLTAFEVVNCDAARYAIKHEENVFFFFNPFDKKILTQVIDNIISSLKSSDRKVLIVYNNPKHKEIIEKGGRFRKITDCTAWTYHFVVYTNQK
jgi:16S rRNA G966 N2-methylase RsmD